MNVAFSTSFAPYEKSKSLGSGGSMVARLKLKGIDGRAPPGVNVNNIAVVNSAPVWTPTNVDALFLTGAETSLTKVNKTGKSPC